MFTNIGNYLPRILELEFFITFCSVLFWLNCVVRDFSFSLSAIDSSPEFNWQISFMCSISEWHYMHVRACQLISLNLHTLQIGSHVAVILNITYT